MTDLAARRPGATARRSSGCLEFRLGLTKGRQEVVGLEAACEVQLAGGQAVRIPI